MLKALYDYGMRSGLAIPPGFAAKPIRAYILLSKSGDYLGIERCDDESQVCPDIGSLANSVDKCNPSAEKADIVLCAAVDRDFEQDEGDSREAKKQKNNAVKKQFFHSMLGSAAEYEPMYAVCLKALEEPEKFSAMCGEAKRLKIKGMDRVSFKVDGVPVVKSPANREWWTQYRKRFEKAGGSGEDELRSRCLITGEPTVPMATLPKINGLKRVGGHASGEALFCFDKAAFRSYGLSQSANAPVSEEAFNVVKDALSDLLAGAPAMYRRDKASGFNPSAPVFAGMKFLHWYDRQIRPEDDVIISGLEGFGGDDDEESDGPGETEIPDIQLSAEQERRADRLVRSVSSGERIEPLPAEYYIILISGANGRAMIRRYEHGSYEKLQNNIALWNDDLALCDNLGSGLIRPQRLNSRLKRLVTRQKADRNFSERMAKELSGFTPSIVMSIINGNPLPDAVAARALAYIRSQMIDPDENDRFSFMPDALSCQWLKLWLTRKSRMRKEEVFLMPYYDKEFPNAAYHCGALMAIYADIQRTAMPDVNAGIVQRYYASASRSPVLVLGRLEGLSKHHLDKIENPGLVRIYENRLNEVYTFFGKDGFRSLPTSLTLEDQSYFAIGYRQMSAQMVAERRSAAARNAVEDAVNKNEQEDA